MNSNFKLKRKNKWKFNEKGIPKIEKDGKLYNEFDDELKLKIDQEIKNIITKRIDFNNIFSFDELI